MKERPILFSGEMVRAILDGRKSQTRRVVKPQPSRYEASDGWGLMWKKKCGGGQSWLVKYCPYGIPGDRLWVRETWRIGTGKDADSGPNVQVKTEPWAIDVQQEHRAKAWALGDRARWSGRWCPSIHMPRWASRITLEVEEVRVERVQEISEEDAAAEGVDAVSMAAVPRQATWTRRQDFAQLWDSINGKRDGCSWEANPWVWCVTFKRLETP